MPKKGGKGVFSRLVAAVTGSSSRRPSSDVSYDPSDYGHSGRWSEHWAEQGDTARGLEQVDEGTSSVPEIVERCVTESSSTECQYMPFLSEAEIDSLPLPYQLVQDMQTFQRNHARVKAKHELRESEVRKLVDEVEDRIAWGVNEGEDHSRYVKKGRGVADERTKVSDQGRVVLVWRNNIPVGPGKWSARFNGLIGCISHNSQIWDLSYTFTENEGRALEETWKRLLKAYYLEDDVDRSYAYIRSEVQDVFKKYRNALKNYTESKTFDFHWQRFVGLPTNVDHDQYAHLLLFWETPEAKAASERASANRAKNEFGYYGGSSRMTRYRHYVEEAGEEAPASAAWSASHLKDDMPEESQGGVQKQYDALFNYETTWRDTHPDYPADFSMPYEEEITMADQIFLTSKAKGKIPLIGPTSLTKSKSRKETSSSGHTPPVQSGWDTWGSTPGQGTWGSTPGQSTWDTWGSTPQATWQPSPPSYSQPPDQSIWSSWQPPRRSQSARHSVQMTDEELENY